jgi:hypothetical protein
MRFQQGIGYPYPELRRPRGRGRGDYRMSRKAGQARQRNLGRVKRLRTQEQTDRIQLEIALWTHRPTDERESLRALAARLGLKSHAYCWRVARNYRAGSIEWLSPAESGLLAVRDSIGPSPTHDSDGVPLTAAANVAQTERECRERLREAHEWQRKHPSYGRRRGGWFRW